MTEAIVVLVPAPDFKSGGGRGDTSSAGSIPVRFRQTEFGFATQKCRASPRTTISDFLSTLCVAAVWREDATELEHDRRTFSKKFARFGPPEVRGRSNDCRHSETGV